MHAQEKTYALALMALVLIGVSAAWGAYQSTTTITITGPALGSVDTKTGTFTAIGKKADEVTLPGLINVTGVPSSSEKIKLRIILLNVNALRDQFDSMYINVTMWKEESFSNLAASGILTLSKSEVILRLTGSTNYYGELVVNYIPSTPHPSATIKLYAEIEQD